jgi:hypothetical protein
MICASSEDPVIFSLTAGKAVDAPAGRDLMLNLDKINGVKFLLVDKAYEGD